jgi:hypothetical protein
MAAARLEVGMFLQHGAMFARRGSAPKGADLRICRGVSISPGPGATTRISTGSVPRLRSAIAW